MSAKMKYTDRDVRENHAFMEGLVLQYLESYEGEFPYLIDCKMRHEAGFALTVGMIRGILNCMRVDPRAPVLPEPMGDETPLEVKDYGPQRGFGASRPQSWENHDFFADVIPMREGYRRPRRQPAPEPVHEIDRSKFGYSYRLPAKIHPEFIFVTAKSASSVLVHKAVWAEIEWYPKHHEWGWREAPQVIVHTNCKYPYSLRNPFLMRVQDVDKYQAEYQLARCVRCWGERDIL